MVHIKRVELTNFKSFGGTTSVPLLPVFTVISGPNGSGKSNILDALLFALGLSSSKGMRAERLPDLVNNLQNSRGTIEASVTVTFDLSDSPDILATTEEAQEFFWGEDDNGNGNKSTEPAHNQSLTEWSVTRKLRVTKQGTYTSTYYANGSPCTLTELHEQLNRLRIYPEGYNVVLQGDVTSIITMNPRERREIIDELAGVAAFDRKIVQARNKLDEVKDREEKSRIVERELIAQRDRLAADRGKAEKYQKLRIEFLQKEQWQIVLVYRQLQQQIWQLREHIEAGERSTNDLNQQLTNLNSEIQQANAELDRLNAAVKAMGEEELIAVQTILATQEAENRQLQNRQQELETQKREIETSISQNQKKVKEYQQTLTQILQQISVQTVEVSSKQAGRNEVQEILTELKQQSAQTADASEAWVQQQTELHRQIETLQQILDPQRTEQARLRERVNALDSQIQEKSQTLQNLEEEIAKKQQQQSETGENRSSATVQVELLSQAVAEAERELQTQQETQKRLLNEQREKQRQLDKLEAQAQAMQEASGTGATQVIIQAGLKGVCGLVAQLGRVEQRYRLALEIAAGEFVALLDHDDELSADALFHIAKEINNFPATDFIYSDEDMIDETGARYTPKFKPDFSRDFLYSVNYATHLAVYRTEILRAVGGFRIGLEGSQDYDLALRVVGRVAENHIRHIPRILYHWRAVSGSIALSGDEKPYAHSRAREAIGAHLERTGKSATVEKAAYNLHRIRYALPAKLPKVTLILAADKNLKITERAIENYVAQTDYANYEIVLVANARDGERKKVKPVL